MEILLNASTVKYGGGLTVALNFIKAFISSNNNHNATLVAPQNVGYEKFECKKLKFIPVPAILHIWIFRFFLDYIWIRKKIKKNNIDFVFSLGNLPIPYFKDQALLFDNPFLTLDTFRDIQLSLISKVRHKLRNLTFRMRLNELSLIFPQTMLQENFLSARFSKLPKTVIVPNSYTTLADDSSLIEIPEISKHTKTKLLALSRYYEHKNLEILIELASLFKETNSEYMIFLTIESHQGKGAKRILRSISDLSMEGYIKNLGEISPFELHNIYYQTDAVILPTLLESFSTVYMDALKYEKPIFTSDREFAREICGDAAFYFNPLSVNDIYEKINDAFSNKSILTEKIRAGKRVIAAHPDWQNIVSVFLREIEGVR